MTQFTMLLYIYTYIYIYAILYINILKQ